MPHAVHRGGTTIGSMRPPEPPGPRAPRWRGDWLPAADPPLDDERGGTGSFRRRGGCRLTLARAHAAGEDDLAALEEAADVLPNLHLFDLDDTADFPERHAEAFGLPEPLAPEAFNASAEVELLAPAGGRPLPRRLGRFELPMVPTGPGPGPGQPPGPGGVEHSTRVLTL